MKKIIRFFVWVVVVIIVLGALAALAIHIFLPPEKAKMLLENELKNRLGREVKLGSVQVGLAKGIEVSNFQLSEKPTFEQGTFLSSDHFSVKIIWPLLLSKKIVIRELSFEHPQVNLIRHADGVTYNFSDLTASSTASVPSAAAPMKSDNEKKSPALDMVILKASLLNGRVVFVDQSSSKQSVTIENLKLTTHALRFKAPIQFESSCRVSLKGEVVDVNLKAGVSLIGDVHIDKVSVKGEKVSLEASGEIKKTSTDNPEFKMKISLPVLDTKLIAKFVSIPTDLILTGTLKGTADVTGVLKNILVKTALDLTGLGINEVGTFMKKASVPLTLNGNISTSEKQIDIVQLQVGMGECTASDAILFGNVMISARLMGPMDNLNYTTSIDATNLTFNYGDSFKKPAGVTLTVDAKGMRTATLTTMDFSSLKLAKADFQGSLKMVSDGKNSGKTLQLKSAGFPLESVTRLAPAADPYQPSGITSLDVTAVLPEKNKTTYKGMLGLNNVAAKYQKSNFTNLNSTIHFTEENVDISALTGNLDGAPIKLSANVTGLGKKMVATLDLNAAVVDVEKLMPPEEPKPVTPKKTDAGNLFVSVADAAPAPVSATPGLMDKPSTLSGHALIGKLEHSQFMAQNVDLKWNLNNVATDLSQLNGSATLRVGEGQIKKVQEKGKSSVFGRILLAPIEVLKKINKSAGNLVKLPSLDELKFKSVTGDYIFKAGVMTVTAFNLNSPEITVGMTGTVGLAGTQPLNLKIPIHTGRTSSAMNSIHLKVGGTVADPAVGLDTAETGKQAIDIIKSGAADNLLKAIGLPGFGGSKQIAPPADSSNQNGADNKTSNDAASQQDDPQKQIESLLKGLFKKK